MYCILFIQHEPCSSSSRTYSGRLQCIMIHEGGYALSYVSENDYALIEYCHGVMTLLDVYAQCIRLQPCFLEP